MTSRISWVEDMCRHLKIFSEATIQCIKQRFRGTILDSDHLSDTYPCILVKCNIVDIPFDSSLVPLFK